MATTATFGSLAVPQPDDSMDMSSPGRHDHEDIDIDFDDFATTDVPVDDAMVDEHESHVMSADADMDDASHPDGMHMLEEEMSDELDDETVVDSRQVAVEEDELIDYNDDDWTEAAQAAENLASAPSTLTDQQTVTPTVPNNENANQNIDAAESVGQEQPAHSAPPLEAESRIEAHSPNTNSGNETERIVEHHVEASTAAASPLGPDGSTKSASINAAHESAQQDVKPTNQILTEHVEVSTDTGLHPVTIVYRNEDIPLFKSQRDPDGLLSDDNLCHVSLSELMVHCKDRLSEMYGESPDPNQEAVLGFASLPLVSLSESCRSAYDQSLHDVLEVYVALRGNEALTESRPFALMFSFQHKFSSSLDLFRQMAQSGAGYSEIAGIPSHSVEQEEPYDEEYDGSLQEESAIGEHGEDGDEIEAVINGNIPDEENQYVEVSEGLENITHDEEHEREYVSEGQVVDDGLNGATATPKMDRPENVADAGEVDISESTAVETFDKDDVRTTAKLEFTQEPATTYSAADSPKLAAHYDTVPTPPKLPEEGDTSSYTNNADQVRATVQGLKESNIPDLDRDNASATKANDEAPENSEDAATIDATLTTTGNESSDNVETASEHVHAFEDDLDADALDESHDDIPFDLNPSDSTAVEELQAETRAISSEKDGHAAEANLPANPVELDEDTIDFDDETTEQYEARTREQPQRADAPDSPVGKRSFSGYADEDVLEFDDDEPDTKKTRSQ